MKYKKYLLFLLLMLVIGLNKTYADDDICFYIGDGFKATFNVEDTEINIDLVGSKADHDTEPLLNHCSTAFRDNTTEAGHTFDNYLDSWCLWSGNINFCPAYLVLQSGCGAEGYRVWGTENINEAKEAAEGINAISGCTGKYAGYKNADGTKITAEKYYSGFVDQELIGHDIEEGKECESIFGDKNYNGEYTDDGEQIRPPSIAYIINTVLMYVRIIVPILIILLGSLDFAKAVTAGKEDEMKKAQITFVKRIVMGVVVFFVPVLVNIIMWLADIVWQGLGYSTCNL